MASLIGEIHAVIFFEGKDFYTAEWYRVKQTSKRIVSLQVVINGGATSSGEQDNEDTELMAIYTTENGIAEKVPLSSAPSIHPPLYKEVPI